MPVVDGLITGINTTSIIDGLLQIRKKRIDELTAQKKEVADRQAAFKQIEAQLIAVRTQASALSRIAGNPFDARSSTSSNEDALSAAGSSKAAVGVYQVRIVSLAQAHQVASQGLEDADSEITTGTLLLRTGNSAEKTITIDSTNNTLQGLADAINSAGAGVSASIVQDATNPAAPARLLLAAQKTGVQNAITLTNNLAASGGVAVRPAFDFDTPVQAAADATVQLGSGAGAITASSTTNTVDGLIGGVTLNLKAADPAKVLTVTVARDAQAAVGAVQNFVDAYNDLADLFAAQFAYVPETKQAGTLLGNQSAASLQAAVREAVLNVVPGINTKANRLSSVGITVTNAGKLVFDSAKLQDVVAGRVTGVTADDVKSLFALNGTSSSGGVQFVLGSTRTGTPGAPVQVDITQAPEHAVVTAGTALAASIVIDDSNDLLSVRVDASSANSLKLSHGTYTPAQLAAQLESVINSSSALSGRTVTVGLNGQALTIQSATYGATSEIAITGGTALADLGFTGNEADFGVDVAGSFIVNGVTETATGRGRLLSGSVGNDNTADLQVRVTLSGSQLQAGVDAEITLTRGVASRLDKSLGRILDPVTGRIKAVNDGFDGTLKTLQAAIDRQNKFFEKKQQELIDQFTALESTVSQLQQTGNYLSAQLSSITKK